MTLIIGVTGFRRCGKDTACKVLVNEFGFKQYAFADSLRNMATAVDPVISIVGAPGGIIAALHQLNGTADYPPVTTAYRYTDILRIIGYDRAKDIPDFRRFLQRLGTEGIRNTFGPNAWVDALARRIDADAPALLCISDVRFGSEADWILSRSGLIWRVNRPGFGGDDPHPSEAEIPHLPASTDITASSVPELKKMIFAAAESIGCVPVPPTVQVSNATGPSPSSSASSTHDPAGPSTRAVSRKARGTSS